MMKADPKQTHVAVQWKYTSPLISCCCDPGGRYLLTSGEDYAIQHWDLSTGKSTSCPAHESWVNDIAILPDGLTAITAACDDTIAFWQVSEEPLRLIRTVPAHSGWVRTVSSSPDGKLIATGGNDNRVKIWSAQTGALIRDLQGHECHVYSTLFHPRRDVLLSGDLKGQVIQWEVSTGKILGRLDATQLHTYHTGQRVDYGGVRSIAISPDDKQIACAGLHKASNPLGAVNEPLVVTFDAKTGKKATAHLSDGVQGIGWKVDYLSDGTLVCASGGRGGGHFLFWTDGEKPIHRLKLPDTIRDMDLHPDGLQLATVHYDRHVRLSRMAGKEQP